MPARPSAVTRGTTRSSSTVGTRVAGRAGGTPGRLALAWLLEQGRDVVPIFGTTRRARLRENLGALGLRLAQAERARLEEVFAPGAVAGERYPDSGLAMLDRDDAGPRAEN